MPHTSGTNMDVQVKNLNVSFVLAHNFKKHKKIHRNQELLACVFQHSANTSFSIDAWPAIIKLSQNLNQFAKPYVYFHF